MPFLNLVPGKLQRFPRSKTQVLVLILPRVGRTHPLTSVVTVSTTRSTCSRRVQTWFTTGKRISSNHRHGDRIRVGYAFPTTSPPGPSHLRDNQWIRVGYRRCLKEPSIDRKHPYNGFLSSSRVLIPFRGFSSWWRIKRFLTTTVRTFPTQRFDGGGIKTRTRLSRSQCHPTKHLLHTNTLNA